MDNQKIGMINFQKFVQERTLLISSLWWLIVNLTESRFTWKMIFWRQLWWIILSH